MRAALLKKLPTAELDVVEVAEPLIGPGEVMVSVAACGICGTDLHIMEGNSYHPELPFVLGHELVGRIIEVAPDVDESWVGRRVAPTLFVGCGRCRACRSHEERLCEEGALATGVIGRHGGFSDRVSLQVHQLVSVPESLPHVVVAGLVDAGVTARNAVRIALCDPRYDEQRHLVVGAGPVGLFVAELLRAAGQDCVIVEPNQLRRRVVTERGYAVASAISDIDGSFSTAIDCAGVAPLVSRIVSLLRPHGLYIAVAYTTLREFDLSVVARRELQIRGVRSGTRGDLEEVLSLVTAGDVLPPPSETWKLDDINEALASLRKGMVQGKAVIVTGS
jgi:propanol-preferring alcohol dehydrogenase